MCTRRLSIALMLLLCASAGWAKSKQPAPPLGHPTFASPAATNDLIQKQFGESCSLLAGPPQIVADLDGDGIDDLIVVGRCGNPLADQDEYKFKVVDPYDKFLGFGDVKVTSGFASDEPERRGVSLLIIHGSGKDAWRAETPKSKFVMINLPFKTISVKRLSLKKRTVLGVFMEERGEGESTSSVVFWDGKKYKYQQIGATFE